MRNYWSGEITDGQKQLIVNQSRWLNAKDISRLLKWKYSNSEYSRSKLKRKSNA